MRNFVIVAARAARQYGVTSRAACCARRRVEARPTDEVAATRALFVCRGVKPNI